MGRPPTNEGYKGGDLLGLAERLDELADLGITALYLNPVFSAASNHRYNAYDYLSVDPLLGGDAALRELLDAPTTAASGSCSTACSTTSARGFWPFHHVLESGGASPYRDWFYLEPEVIAGRRRVQRVRRSPRRSRQRARLPLVVGRPVAAQAPRRAPGGPRPPLAVAEHWLRFGIDGWRLDVPQDVEDPTFWPEFRRRVRAVNPEAYIVGEIWDEGRRSGSPAIASTR